MPGVEEYDHVSEVGKGVGIKVMDSSSISDPRLARYLEQAHTLDYTTHP